MKFDTADWTILALVSAAWFVSTVYLFKYPGLGTFGTWCGFGATVTGTYHWLRIRDSKQPDAKQ